MKVAFTYNLRLTDVRETEKEAEYDSAETVNAIAAALEAAGHEVEKVEVSGPAVEPARAARGDRSGHHLQHRRGRSRPHARSVLPGAVRGARHPVHGLRRVHERDHARQVADQADGPARRHRHARGVLVTPAQLRATPRARRRAGVPGDRQAEPRGLEQGDLQRRSRAADRRRSSRSRATSSRALKAALRAYPDGVLVEEYIEGMRRRGRLHRGRRPRRRPAHAGRGRPRAPSRASAVQHLRLPAEERRARQGPVPLPGEPAARRRGAAAPDLARGRSARSACATWRGSTSGSRAEGRIYLLEVNALPALATELVAVRGDRAGRPHLQRRRSPRS